FEILMEILEDKANLNLPETWKRHYELGRNKHWKSGNDKASLISANLLYTHRQRTVNMLTDNNPTFNVTKLGDPNREDDEAYNDLLYTTEHWWIDQEQQIVLDKSITNGETYGVTIEKGTFNPDAEFNIGEVEILVVDPFHFGFYPVKCKDPYKAEAHLHYWPMSVKEARRKWPKFADKITSDTEFLEELGDDRREVTGGRPGEPNGYWSTFASAVKHMLNISTDGKQKDDELLVVECWAKDYSTKEDGTPKYTGNIRCVTALNGGRLVVDDRSNPSISPLIPDEQAQKCYLYDKFPFSFTQSVTDTAVPWAMGDFEQLKSLNIEVDKTLSQFTLYKDKAARLKLINPMDSGVPNQHLTNYPGIIRPANKFVAEGIRYLDPPQPPGDLIATLQLYKDFFFLVGATFELEMAKTPGRDVIAYKAIAALLERAAMMVRGKVRNYSKMIRERGRMYVSLAQNFYTEDRWIEYEEEGEKLSKIVSPDTLRIPAKLTVVSGSTMPVSKIQEREEALALFKMQAIDGVELLKKLEWPDRKNVIKRMSMGPLAEFFKRIAKLGVPPQLIQYFQQAYQLEDKEVEKSLEKGEFPPFAQVLSQIVGGGEGGAPPPTPTEQAEAEKTMTEAQKNMAEIVKIRADAALIAAKIRTEEVEQEVKMAGIGFDQEKLKIERAKTVDAIQDAKDRIKIDRAKVANEITRNAEQTGTPPYREKGLKSNNQE
ncbi:MAG: hypothetical protein KJ556_20840, partial [Gammaproteobacteria bacterium]|nr:hypothetical protein [Gammaproteobacteria bacterium]